MEDENALFTYLNRAGRWLDFSYDGLALGGDGALKLEPLPRLAGPPPPELAALTAMSAPGGVTALPDGSVIYSDTANQRLLVIDSCDRARRPLPCLGGHGSAPGELSE